MEGGQIEMAYTAYSGVEEVERLIDTSGIKS